MSNEETYDSMPQEDYEYSNFDYPLFEIDYQISRLPTSPRTSPSPSCFPPVSSLRSSKQANFK